MTLQTKAMPLYVNDLAVMQESVEDGGGDDGIAEEFLPVGEVLVGGNDGGASFIPVGDELEEEVCLLAGNREIPNLIHKPSGVQVRLFDFRWRTRGDIHGKGKG